MIRVTLEFGSNEELVAYFSKPQIVTDKPAAPAPVAAAAPEAPAPKKPGRPKKSEPAAGGASDNPTAAPSAVQTPPAAETSTAAPQKTPESIAGGPTTTNGTGDAATLDDVRKFAQQVVEKLGNERGMSAARQVLQEKAGVKVIRDVPAAKAADVVEGLKALLA